jgi:ADP-L-glycero-D-manno-heptose 6-epimerase
MIVVTGGAGFIGSNLVAALSDREVPGIVVADVFGDGDKWRNIAKHEVADIVPPDDLVRFLINRSRRDDSWGRIDAVIHLGANSSTTETDVDLILRQNYAFSMRLWRLCSEYRIRLIHASSAATYGDGSAGFEDAESSQALAQLRPLNPYGWSKHLFDQRVARWSLAAETRPPQWAGLKFFNVYGPNEYHKGSMQSVVAQKYPQVRDGEPVTLFRSHNPDYADGGQLRDFIHVDDCVKVILWLLDHPQVNGLFNVGTGEARSFLDLARAIFAASGVAENITYIDTPASIRDQYQYFTQASMTRLRRAGYSEPFRSLEDGVANYVKNYLATNDWYR